MKIRILILSFVLLCGSMDCAKIKGLGIDYSRLGDQNIEGFEFKQTLPDGTVNYVKFDKEKGGEALVEALKAIQTLAEKIPIP